MDGLTISTANKLLQTGKTTSQIAESENKLSSAIGKEGPSFSDTLSKAIKNVNELQKDADIKMQKLATGENKNIPDVLIASEKADIALRLMIQVRNKIVEAYQEIMKMQV